MSSVQIRDVRKSFGGFEVLHGVSIPIEDGAFVVLLKLEIEDLGTEDRIVGSDIFGPAGARKNKLLFFLIRADLLAGLDDQGPVRLDVPQVRVELAG